MPEPQRHRPRQMPPPWQPDNDEPDTIRESIYDALDGLDDEAIVRLWRVLRPWLESSLPVVTCLFCVLG